MSFTFGKLIEKAKESSGFDALPVGRYTVKSTESAHVQAASGKDMFKVTFEVIEGPHTGSKIFNNYVITPDNANAIHFFLKHMAAFGVTAEYLASEPGFDNVAKSLLDKVVQLDLTIDNTYDGTDRNKVKNTLAPPAGYENAAPSTKTDPFKAAAVAQATSKPPSSPF